jgi:hypothetical protein
MEMSLGISAAQAISERASGGEESPRQGSTIRR